MNYTPAPSDYIHPRMKYGDKPGEQRLPSYQEGGYVPQDQVAKLDEGEHVLDPDKAVAWRQAERDVAPEEMRHEGIMVDIGGAKAIPNPKGIKPMMDTDKPEPNLDYKMDEKGMLPGGARMNIDNAPINRQVHQFPSGVPMDISNTPISKPGDIGMVDPKAQAAAAQMQEISTKAPVQQSDIDTVHNDIYDAMQSGNLHDLGMAKINERMLKSALPLPEPTAPPAPSPEQRQQEENDLKYKALHAPNEKERVAATTELRKRGESGQQNQAAMGAQAAAAEPAATAAVAGAPPAAEPEIPKMTPAMPAYMGNKRIGKGTPGEAELGKERQDEVNQLKYTMAHGSQEEAAVAQERLARLEQGTPWGSPSNHPGVMGKIGHVASRIGQAALMPTAPYMASAIPGSQVRLGEQRAAGVQGIEQAQKQQLTAADIKIKEAQPAMNQEKFELMQQKQASDMLKAGFKKNAITGEFDIPVPYNELPADKQALYDKNESIKTLNTAKGHEQEAKAVLDRYKADPNNPQNQAALGKLQLEGKKLALAGEALGLHQKQFLADYYGVNEKGDPIPGVETTETGQPVGVKVGKATQVGQTIQMKGVQARNVQDNLNKAIDLIQQNPDLFGKVSGRFTTTREMIGSNDIAIDRLGNLIHNAALASTSVHGLRGEVAVEATEKELLNHFKNSPEATIAGMQDTVDSMSTFTNAAVQGAKKTITAPTKKEGGAATPPKGSTHTGVSSVDGKTYYLDANGKKLGEVKK